MSRAAGPGQVQLPRGLGGQEDVGRGVPPSARRSRWRPLSAGVPELTPHEGPGGAGPVSLNSWITSPTVSSSARTSRAITGTRLPLAETSASSPAGRRPAVLRHRLHGALQSREQLRGLTGGQSAGPGRADVALDRRVRCWETVRRLTLPAVVPARTEADSGQPIGIVTPEFPGGRTVHRSGQTSRGSTAVGVGHSRSAPTPPNAGPSLGVLCPHRVKRRGRESAPCPPCLHYEIVTDPTSLQPSLPELPSVGTVYVTVSTPTRSA